MGEWFSVVQGCAELQLWDPEQGLRRSIRMEAADALTVRVPAGLAHCLVQQGDVAMIAVAWATAEYDPDDVVPASTVSPEDPLCSNPC